MKKFLIIVFSFIAFNLVGNCYHFDLSLINFWLALGAVLWLNPTEINIYELAIFCVLALIVSLFFPLKLFAPWFLLIFLIILSYQSKKNNNIDKLIIYLACFFNLCFITNTSYTDVQYDFLSCYNYIEYIIENNFLFWQENPLLTRPSYSSFHPILHFFLAGVCIRLLSFFADNLQAVNETTQLLFCSYMLWYYLISAKILRLLNLSFKVYLAGIVFIAFFPIYNAMAGYFNNDCLLLPLQASTVYYALCYSKTGEKRNLVLIFIFMTASCLTKLSGILTLPFVVLALFFRFLQTKEHFKELAILGLCLAIGIAIWPLYQHFILDVSSTFVPKQEHLSLKSYSFWQRFNPIGAFYYEQIFYHNFGINLWETMTKTALFGQWDFSYRAGAIMMFIPFLVVIYKSILAIAYSSIIYFVIIKKYNKDYILSLVLLFSLLGGQILFSLLHPYMCNQDFKYVAILPLALAMILCLYAQNCLLLKKVYLLIIGIFAFISTFIWWWVAAIGG